MSQLRKVTRTPVTLAELAGEIWRIWPDAEPIDIAIIFGKMVAECGWPGKEQCLWNYNVGNIRGTSLRGNYCILGRAYEIVDANKIPKGWYVVPNTFGASVPAGKVCVLPVNPGESQRFRAYDTLAEAVEEYFFVLGKNFRNAWAELQAKNSDARRFVYALKSDRYFTGDVTRYIVNAEAGVRSALPALAILPRPIADDPEEYTNPDSPSGKRISETRIEIMPRAKHAPPIRAGAGEHRISGTGADDDEDPYRNIT